MADAHGSGPCGGNPVKVQLLSPAPYVLRAAPGHRGRFAWRAGPGVPEPAVRAASKPSGGPRRPLDSGEATTCQTLGTLRTEGVAASGRPVRSGRSHKQVRRVGVGLHLPRGGGCRRQEKEDDGERRKRCGPAHGTGSHGNHPPQGFMCDTNTRLAASPTAVRPSSRDRTLPGL